MHFAYVELVEQHGSTRSSRHARYFERVVSRRDVTSRVEFGLMSYLFRIRIKLVIIRLRGKHASVNVFYNSNEFCVFRRENFYILLINYQSGMAEILTLMYTLNCFFLRFHTTPNMDIKLN